MIPFIHGRVWCGTFPSSTWKHALAFSSLSHGPIFICSRSFQGRVQDGSMAFVLAPAQTSGGHQQSFGPSSWVAAVWKMLEFPTFKAESSERTGKLLCAPGKDMPSSRAGEQAPCWWHSPWKLCSMVTENIRETRALLQGWCSARAVPLLNHCMAAQQIISCSCKPAWVQIAEAAPGVGLHEEVDVCCRSWWVGAPRGLLGAALSFSISHLASLEPSMASHILCFIISSMTPKWRVWKFAARSVRFMFLANATSVTCCALTSSWETTFWPVRAFF